MPIGPEILGHLAIFLVVLFFAVSVHECGHAWMSYKFGDDTAYLLGRVTLDPRSHVDPIGTLLIPIVGFIFSQLGGSAAQVGALLIGWGKPTPVNPLRWRNKNFANVMVSLAGIMANTIVATGALVIIKAMLVTDVFRSEMYGLGVPVRLLLFYTLLMNASLAVFNLLPFPPLDGGHVLESVLPPSAQPFLEMLQQYGFIILLVFVYLGLFRIIFAPFEWLIFFILAL